MTDTIDSLILEDYPGADETSTELNEYNISLKQNLVDRMAQQFSISILEEALKAAAQRAETNQLSQNIPRSADLDNLIKYVEECPKVPQKIISPNDDFVHSRQKSSTQMILYQPKPNFVFASSPKNETFSDIKSLEQKTSFNVSNNYDQEQPIQPVQKESNDLLIKEHSTDDGLINDDEVKEEVSVSNNSAKKSMASEEQMIQKSIQSLETLQRKSTDQKQDMSMSPRSMNTIQTNEQFNKTSEKEHQVKENKIDVEILNHVHSSNHLLSDLHYTDSIQQKKRRSEEISHASPDLKNFDRKNVEREVKAYKRKSENDKSKSSQAWETSPVEKTESKYVNAINTSENNTVRL